jgi:hypothetical protein
MDDLCEYLADLPTFSVQNRHPPDPYMKVIDVSLGDPDDKHSNQ